MKMRAGLSLRYEIGTRDGRSRTVHGPVVDELADMSLADQASYAISEINRLYEQPVIVMVDFGAESNEVAVVSFLRDNVCSITAHVVGS
jgi:hypothetical protein